MHLGFRLNGHAAPRAAPLVHTLTPSRLLRLTQTQVNTRLQFTQLLLNSIQLSHTKCTCVLVALVDLPPFSGDSSSNDSAHSGSSALGAAMSVPMAADSWHGMQHRNRQMS